MTTCKRPTCGRPAEPGRRGYCESDYRRTIRMGIHGWRDPARARAHVLRLRGLGWTWEQIGDAAGVSTWVPHQLGTGRTRHLWPESHDALLALPLVPRGSHRGVDSTGTRRRVQALAWMGWTTAEVARRAGTTPSSLSTLILPSRRPSFDLALRVAAVYEELCMVPGSSKIAAAKARGLGFAPPLAWEGLNIDDPDVVPDVGEEVSLTQARIEDVEELMRHTGSLEATAARLGISEAYVRKLLCGRVVKAA